MDPAATPIRRVETHETGADGGTLFRRAWLPPEPRAAMLWVHGYAEHCGRYEWPGAWFAERGFAVHAYDQRGHGRSEGRRTHVLDFDEYLDDLDIVLDAVRAAHPGLPLTLVGHSMGGLVVLASLTARKPTLSSAVTSGAALALGKVSPIRRALAKGLARFAPTLSMAPGLALDGLSRDPEVVQRYVDDPLVSRSMTAGLGNAMIETAPRTVAAAASVEVPLLLLHGEDDPIADASGSREFHAGVKAPASALQVYPGLRHEIFNEPEREQVYADILSWLGELPEPVA